MDIRPFNEEFYRLKFREYLREKDNTLRRPKDIFLVADVYLSQRPNFIKPPSQDPGEIKHHAIDEDAAVQSVSQEFLPGIQETSEDKPSDYAYQYTMYDTSFSSWETRKLMEDSVRKQKRSRAPCPHCDPRNLCLRPFIRCGERMQYSTPETQQQRRQPHRCNYDPAAGGSSIVIVDKEESVRNFLAGACVLFLGYDNRKILLASTGKEAVALLNQCKVENKRCGLVVCDIELPGMSGFDLVNEIYFRNFDTDIILMKEKRDPVPKPQHYAGDTEIVPGEPLVKAVLEKPFHSGEFIKIVKSILQKTPS
jgi:CheY-like chemotaxis protein